MFPQLPNRPHTVIHISGSPHCEFSVSCLHCVKNFTSVCRRQRSTFINVNVYQAHTKENEASLFLFYFHIHTWFAIRFACQITGKSILLKPKLLCSVLFLFLFYHLLTCKCTFATFAMEKFSLSATFFACFCMWAYESPDEGKRKMGGKKKSSQLRWQDHGRFFYTPRRLLFIIYFYISTIYPLPEREVR